MVTPLDEIDIAPEQIGHALTDKMLRVPPNQRDFSWKEKHVEDLYTDIAEAIDKGGFEYFLGSIVVVRSKGANDLLVVDGQQRLATSLIMLAAIRDFLQISLEDKEGAERFERRFMFKEEFLSKDNNPRLVLNERDHPYFLSRVLLDPSHEKRKAVEGKKATKDSHQKIDKAARIAAKQVKSIVSGLRSDRHAATLNKWVDFFEHKARVIWVTVPDESSAYVIFETMNDRGLELSAADLIKNYLFGRADTDLEAVKYNWFRMVGTIDTLSEADATKEYVRHFWISKNGTVRSQQLFEAIKRKVRNSRLDAVNLVQELADAAVSYVAIATPTHPHWNDYGDDARKTVDTLNTLGVIQIRPLLLAAVSKFDKREMVKLLKRSVSWAVRLLIAGTQGSGALETIYGDAAFGIANGSLVTANDVSAQMEKAVPKDDKFELDFSEANVSKSHLARYYLRAMERQLMKEPEPYFLPNIEVVINAEHVMPEKLNEEWAHISKETYDGYLNRIGNQVLVQASINSLIGQRGYDFKKPYLKGAEFKLTQMAAEHGEWDAPQIEDRQKTLAKIAVATWPLRPK
jgi:hypothetical protein